jgi:hypothetical protein
LLFPSFQKKKDTQKIGKHVTLVKKANPANRPALKERLRDGRFGFKAFSFHRLSVTNVRSNSNDGIIISGRNVDACIIISFGVAKNPVRTTRSSVTLLKDRHIEAATVAKIIDCRTKMQI